MRAVPTRRPADAAPTARRALIARARERLLRTSSPRLHATLFVAGAGLTAFLASVSLLRLGIDGIALRYALATIAGYAGFVLLIRLWIAWQRDGGPGIDRFVDDVVTGGRGASGPPVRFGGGRSGGAGASASFAPAPGASAPSAGSTRTTGASGGIGLGIDLEADELVWIVVALALALAGLAAVCYVIYVAPLLLADVALDATLLGGAYRTLRREEAQHWATGVLRQTALPALVVMLCAAGIGYCGQRLAPGARSIGGVVRALGTPGAR